MEREDEIRTMAYYIWAEEGFPEGRALDHWVKAEIIWEENNKRKSFAKPKLSSPKKASRE